MVRKKAFSLQSLTRKDRRLFCRNYPSKNLSFLMMANGFVGIIHRIFLWIYPEVGIYNRKIFKKKINKIRFRPKQERRFKKKRKKTRIHQETSKKSGFAGIAIRAVQGVH